LKILIDKGQKEGKHTIKEKWFMEHGIEFEKVPLPVGDYILSNDKTDDVINRKSKRATDLKKMDFLGTHSISVDTKENMSEIINNLCGKAHDRFRDECILGQNNGIKLYVLVENKDGVKCIDDVFKWQNPRMHRYNKIKYMHSIGKWSNIPLPKAPPTNGPALAKTLFTMQKKYGVTFLFCKPDESAEMIVTLLTGK